MHQKYAFRFGFRDGTVGSNYCQHTKVPRNCRGLATVLTIIMLMSIAFIGRFLTKRGDNKNPYRKNCPTG